MSCSVVMVILRSSPGLLAAIKRVLAQKELAELIVADCGAWPDVLARLQQMALTDPKLKITAGQQSGFSAACNAAAKQATGDFLLLLSPDFLLPPGALSDITASFKETGEVAAAGLKTVAATPHEFIGIHGKEASAASISLLCVKTADFRHLSGLDETLSPKAAGLDLCARLCDGGKRIATLPQLAVAKLPGGDGAGWRGAKDMLRYQCRHFWKRHKSPWLPLSCLATLAASTFNSVREENGRTISMESRRLLALAVGLADLPETGELRGKTVIVTGAATSVGLSVVRRMLAAGAMVVAISPEKVAFPHERLNWIVSSLHEAALPKADIAIACSGLPELPPELERFAGAGVKRLVAIGSATMYTHALSRDRQERLAAAKLAAAEGEITTRATQLDVAWTVLRPTLTYGTGLDDGITASFRFMQKFGFFPIYPPALGRRQPVHADDVALAALKSALTPASTGKSYNLSGGEILTCRELLTRLFTAGHMPVRLVSTRLLSLLMSAGALVPGTAFSADAARRMNDDLIFFHDDARRDLGFAPRQFLNGGIHDLEGF